jgi:glyceraldehyde-3-phosphate dehydrogenase/erythrose-4-phosphate dehydrogenase
MARMAINGFGRIGRALFKQPINVSELEVVALNDLAQTEDPSIIGRRGQHFVSIVDLGLTQIIDVDLVKVLSWHDNEWGHAARMIRETRSLLRS